MGFLFQIILLVALQSFASARTWTSSDGRTMEATYLSATAETVTLRKDRDQSTITIPLAKLSVSDQNIVLSKLGQELKPKQQYASLITGNWEPANFKGQLPYQIFGGRSLQADKRYPLVIYLHGIHLRGDDNQKHLTGEAKSFGYANNYKLRPCIIIAPQCPKKKFWSGKTNTDVLALIEVACEHLPIDRKRIYLSGYSMGGFGIWDLLARKPDLFAAAIPVAGGGDPAKAKQLTHIPIWAFHGEKDIVVPASKSRQMVDALKQEGGKINYTEYKAAGHLITRRVFKDESIHRWLFRQRLVAPGD